MEENKSAVNPKHEAALKEIAGFSARGLTAQDAMERMRDVARKALK